MPRKNATRPGPAQLKTDAMVAELKAADSADHNARFLVLSYDIAADLVPHHVTRTRVYLLNPGQHFAGFGGSRYGLLVKTRSSLIIRQTGPFGLRDHESDIADPCAWGTINAGLKLAAAQGTLWHVGTVSE